MSKCYLYAITDQPKPPMPVIPATIIGMVEGGPGSLPIVSLGYQEIAAVIGRLDTPELPATEANLWRHETVVETLMASRAVLPVRFGTVLADEAAVRSFLVAQYDVLLAGLQRVRGRVELGLRVLWNDAGADRLQGDHSKLVPSVGQRSAGISGREYMFGRLETERRTQASRQRAEALAAALHAPLALLAEESVQQLLPTPAVLLKSAYMVERDRVAAFRQETEALSGAYPSLRFVCTGPWPAYNFVAIGTQERAQ